MEIAPKPDWQARGFKPRAGATNWSTHNKGEAMPTDMRALKAAGLQKREDDRKAVKLIPFQLPDAKGAEWNVYSLTAKADWLMVEAGTSEALRAEFRSQATTGGFDGVLEALDQWFTVMVRSSDFGELDEPLLGYYYRMKQEADSEEERILAAANAAEEDDPILAAAMLDEFDARAAAQARKDEIAQRTIQLVRDELGLSDDEDIIVRVVKKKG